jgi:hypothetical protein
MERIRYSDHDVVDTGKFPKFVQQVYMDSIGTCPFGYPMMQPKQWAVGPRKNRDPEPCRDSPLRQEEISE